MKLSCLYANLESGGSPIRTRQSVVGSIVESDTTEPNVLPVEDIWAELKDVALNPPALSVLDRAMSETSCVSDIYLLKYMVVL